MPETLQVIFTVTIFLSSHGEASLSCCRNSLMAWLTHFMSWTLSSSCLAGTARASAVRAAWLLHCPLLSAAVAPPLPGPTSTAISLVEGCSWRACQAQPTACAFPACTTRYDHKLVTADAQTCRAYLTCATIMSAT